MKLKEKVLNLLANARLEQLDEKINSDAEYSSVRKEQLELQEKLGAMELSGEQKAVVQEMLAKANQCGAIYGKNAYKQGVRDGAECMKELKAKK